jgi:hypothetical protein
MKEEAKAKRRKNLNIEETLDACEPTHSINIYCNLNSATPLYFLYLYKFRTVIQTSNMVV